MKLTHFLTESFCHLRIPNLSLKYADDMIVCLKVKYWFIWDLQYEKSDYNWWNVIGYDISIIFCCCSLYVRIFICICSYLPRTSWEIVYSFDSSQFIKCLALFLFYVSWVNFLIGTITLFERKFLHSVKSFKISNLISILQGGGM